MDSNTASQKWHTDHSSDFSPNLANCIGSDSLIRFLKIWLMDWLTLPIIETASFSFANGDWCLIGCPHDPSLMQLSSKLTFLKDLEAQVKWRMHILSVFFVGYNCLSVTVLITQSILKNLQVFWQNVLVWLVSAKVVLSKSFALSSQ